MANVFLVQLRRSGDLSISMGLSIQFLAAALVIFSTFIITTEADAAGSHKNKKIALGLIKISDDNSFSAETPAGAEILCYDNGKKQAAGREVIKRKKRFLQPFALAVRVTRQNLKAVNAQLLRTPIKRKKLAALRDQRRKLMAEMKELKPLLKAGQKTCASAASLLPAPDTLTAAQAHHLFRRAGFGARPEDIQRAVAQGLRKTVDALLTEVPTPELDAEAASLFDGYLDKDEPEYLQAKGIRWAALNYMQKSPNQLKEKMVYFWHDLLASSHRVLGGDNLHWLVAYQDIIRSNALGNFRTIAQGMSVNGMMMKWLNLVSNKRLNINEDWAREWWELFSLGRGYYTEADIEEAAKAFTGWSMKYDNDYKKEVRYFSPELFDSSVKTIFAGTKYEQRGNFNNEDLINLTLDVHPEAPKHLAKALYGLFVSTDPPASIVKDLGKIIKKYDYDVKPAIRKILLSKAFFSPKAIRDKIKTPIEYTIGFLRNTGLPIDIDDLEDRQANMGQVFFNPPSVKGWDDNEYWLNDQWMMARIGFPNSVFNSIAWYDDKNKTSYNYSRFASSTSSSWEEVLANLTSMMDIQLSDSEKQNFYEYLNYTKDWDDKKKPKLFDARGLFLKDEDGAYSDGGYAARKVRGAIYLLAQMPQYQMN